MAGGRIAFVDLDGQLQTMGPSGEAPRAITRAGGRFAFSQFPAWSPDGQSLAAIAGDGVRTGVYVFADRAGAEPDEGAGGRVGLSWTGPLRLFDAGTRALRTVTDEPVLAFFWAPDGQTIAYLTLDLPSRPVRAGYTNGANGHTPEAQLANRVRLAVSLLDTRRAERRRLAQFAPLELFVAQFLPFFDQYALSHRLWSPDSAALVLPAELGGTPTVIRLDAADGRMTPLAPGVMAAWSG